MVLWLTRSATSWSVRWLVDSKLSIGCSFKKSPSIRSCSPYSSSLSMTSRPWRISARPRSSTLTGAGGRRGTATVFTPSFLGLPDVPLEPLALLLGVSVVNDRLRLELMGTRFEAEAALAAERRREACVPAVGCDAFMTRTQTRWLSVCF